MAKILIVDDDENNRLLLTTLLEHMGHRSLEAATGATALATAASERPDLVIVDLSLPDIPGVELIRRLRRDEGTGLRIALYTATQVTSATDEIIETYALDGIVPKPADPQQILAALQRLLSPV